MSHYWSARALQKLASTWSTSNIIQVDGSSTSTKEGIIMWNSTCNTKRSSKFNRSSYENKSALTSSGCITQLPANYSGINTAPTIMTNSSPLIIDAHLHSTLILIGASHQTNIAISTESTAIHYRVEHIYSQNVLYLELAWPSSQIWYSCKPWHRTPAYEWTEGQLTVELRGQSVRLVSLSVHWTSSRYTVRVPELAPKWELRKATASVEGEKSLTESNIAWSETWG